MFKYSGSRIIVMINIQDLRNKVLDIVKLNGPVLPIQISRKLGSDTILAGAVLSELLASKQIKISTAKIGGSPVYYILGQEEKLSILYDHLPQKEKEAFNLLKSNHFLRDQSLEPSIRIALRNIKDFAVPLEFDLGNGKELIWKWHLAKDDDVNLIPKIKTEIQQKISQQNIQPIKKIKEKTEDNFSKLIQKFINENKIILLEQQIVRKNTEINMIVKVPSNLGDIEFMLIAKNKKSISETDLALAHNKSQMKKLPAIFLSTGELTKKAKSYLEKNLKGYITFRKI